MLAVSGDITAFLTMFIVGVLSSSQYKVAARTNVNSGTAAYQLIRPTLGRI